MNELHKQVLTELQEQNKNYTDAYWEIYDNKEAVPADQQTRMREELLKNYSRTVALIDGQAGLDKEQEIANLEIQRIQINEEARLRKAELAEEYRLKHVELKERTDTEAARLTKEFEIKRRAEEETLNIKAEQIVPVREELPRRWWERLFRRPARVYTNYAYELATQKANLEANKYFSAREDEILKLEAEQSNVDELTFAVRKEIDKYTGGKTKGRKAKIINKALSEFVEPLCEMFARRERALNELIKRLSENDSKVFDESPGSESEEEKDLQNAEQKREELQFKAVSLLSAFCLKRIDDLQQDKLNKPKRQRKRKLRSGE